MAKKKVQMVDGVETDNKNNTSILPCGCENTYQDEKYGKNKRVFNRAIGKTGAWRCTVCGNLKS